MGDGGKLTVWKFC